MTRVILVVGSTETASIDGISAAGADTELMTHTPSADAEVLTYGQPIRAPVVPVSPTGCPTPAVVTRAVREELGFDLTVVDGGLGKPSGAPTVTVGAQSGSDIREEDPVPTAPGAYEAARQFGRALPDDEIFLAESIPGGTTTALGVLEALGERGAVSSSLPENPVAQKRTIVDDALAASNLEAGDAARDPKLAVRRMGDPVLAVATGLARGALETETAVTFAGGTQMLAVIALLRHGGIDQRLPLATTTFVLEDESAQVEALAADLSVDVTTSDPRFDGHDHPAFEAYARGEAKEGVGMGGALALADRAGVPMESVRDRIRTVYDRVVESDSGQ